MDTDTLKERCTKAGLTFSEAYLGDGQGKKGEVFIASRDKQGDGNKIACSFYFFFLSEA